MQVSAFDPAHVALFFANPYPLSPAKSLRVLLMELWGESFEAAQTTRFEWSDEQQQTFTAKLLDVNTLVDLFAAKNDHDTANMHGLIVLVTAIEKSVYSIKSDTKNEYLGCIKIVLDRIKTKMEQINRPAP